MTINVVGPDGSNLAFPDGTPEADIVAAMSAHYGTKAAPTHDPADPRFTAASNVGGKFLEGVPVLGAYVPQVGAALSAAGHPLTGVGRPGETWGERYEKNLTDERSASKAFEAENPGTSIAAKIGGGVASIAPVVMAAPRLMGAAGTMKEMITKGAASGAAIAAADAAARGHDIGTETAIGGLTGAAGGPLGHAIGKVASKIVSRGDTPVPRPAVPVAGVDVPSAPTDPVVASKVEIARTGAVGGPAQRAVQADDEGVAASIKQAQDNIAAQLDPTGTSANATPQQAAQRIADELQAAEQTRFQTEQAATQRATQEGQQVHASLAPDPYTGQPLNVAPSAYDAAERIGPAVATERQLARRDVGARYDEANAVPGAFDPVVPRTMGEEVRAIVSRGDDGLWIDPDTTSAANSAIKMLDQTLGSGRSAFDNAAAARPGTRPAAGAAAPVDVPPAAPAAALAPALTPRRQAYDELIRNGAEPDKAAKAVANLPGEPGDIPQAVTAAAGGGALDRHTVATAAGGSVEVQPRVVEASSLKTSADPGYAQDLQPRNRQRAASDAQIQDMSKNLTPSRLGVSSEADRGAPIIGDDLMVESGNGRVLAIRQAYAQGGAQAQKYRDWLQSQGVDVSQYREPVLVRERVTPMSNEERKAFTVAANQSSTLSLAASERALADSRALTPDVIGLIRNPDDLGAVGNRDFVRQFVGSLPVSERAGMMTASGDLSSEGLTRVRNAVMAKAYGNSSILQRAAESTKDEVKSISTALLHAAPEWAQLRAAVVSGLVPKELDATVHLLDAVERTARIRGKGTSLAEGLAQSDAFTQQSPQSEAFMRLFYSADGKSAASSANVSSALRHYAQEAAKVDAAPGLNLGLAPVTASDILAVTSKKVGAPAALAEEVAKAAQEAIPKGAAPISEVGVREMDQARKRLNEMRKQATARALAPGGDGSDLRAMNKIINAFDEVITKAHADGRFSGDSELADRLIKEARASHAAYRETFTSRGGKDPTGRAVEKILGRYHDTAATPDEIAKLSYGPANNPGGGDAARVGVRLRGIFGETSPDWGAYKQGLAKYVEGDPAVYSAAERGERIKKYLTSDHGKTHANFVLSAEERAAFGKYADNLIASEPVPLSKLTDVQKQIRRITGADGHPPASQHEIITALMGGPNAPGRRGVNEALAVELKRVMSPEGFAQVKQGALAHLLTTLDGVPDRTFPAMVKSLSNFLGTGMALKLYTGKEIADIRQLRDAIKAAIPPEGTKNPSGTAPMLTKIAKGMASWVLPVLGFSHGGLIGAGIGVAATKGVGKIADARAAREVRNLLQGPQPMRPVDPRFARTGALLTQGAGRQIQTR